MSELVGLKRNDLVEVTYKVFDISFNDEYLAKWVMHLMHNVCRKIVKHPLSSNYSLINHLGVVVHILQRPRFMTAWLMSPYFYQDLELIYSLHLMTTQEWKNLLNVVYHPLLNKSYSNKIKYEKNFNSVAANFDK